MIEQTISTTYNANARALYVKLNDSRVVETIPIGELNFDVDAGGKAVGAEFIFLPSIPQEKIDVIVNTITTLLNQKILEEKERS